MKLYAERLDADALIPVREHPTDAGIDFFSLKNEMLNPGERKLLSTGVRLQIPEGHVLFLKDKSGLAAKNGIHIMAGVIDEDYRGEIKVLVINHSIGRYDFKKGSKICQGVLLPVSVPEVEETRDIPTETSRGEKGFGSTGTEHKDKVEVKAKESQTENIQKKLDDIKIKVVELLDEYANLKNKMK